MPPTRPPGLYEELVTRRLEAALEEIRGAGWRDEVDNLDPAEAPGVLARFVHDLVEPLLGSLTGDDRTARQLEIVNNLVDHLSPRSTTRPSSTTTPSRRRPASSSPSSTQPSTGWGRPPPRSAHRPLRTSQSLPPRTLRQ